MLLAELWLATALSFQREYVAAIKAGGTIDVPCKMPFKSQKGMRCEFILNPDKTIAEASYANNRTTTLKNPKFN